MKLRRGKMSAAEIAAESIADLPLSLRSQGTPPRSQGTPTASSAMAESPLCVGPEQEHENSFTFGRSEYAARVAALASAQPSGQESGDRREIKKRTLAQTLEEADREEAVEAAKVAEETKAAKRSKKTDADGSAPHKVAETKAVTAAPSATSAAVAKSAASTKVKVAVESKTGKKSSKALLKILGDAKESWTQLLDKFKSGSMLHGDQASSERQDLTKSVTKWGKSKGALTSNERADDALELITEVISPAKRLQSLIAAFEAFQEECNIRTANQLVVLCNDAVSAENCGGEAAKGYIATDEMPAAMRQAFLACSRVVLHQSGNVREAFKCLAFSRLMSVGHSKSTGTLEQFKFFKVDVFTKILAKADAKGFSVHQTTAELRPFLTECGKIMEEGQSLAEDAKEFDVETVTAAYSVTPCCLPELFDTDSLSTGIKNIKDPKLEILRPFRTYDSGIAIREFAEEALKALEGVDADIEKVKKVKVALETLLRDAVAADLSDLEENRKPSCTWMTFKVATRCCGDELAEMQALLFEKTTVQKTVQARLGVSANDLVLQFIDVLRRGAAAAHQAWQAGLFAIFGELTAFVGLQLKLPPKFTIHTLDSLLGRFNSLQQNTEFLLDDLQQHVLAPTLTVSDETPIKLLENDWKALIVSSKDLMAAFHNFGMALGRVRLSLRDGTLLRIDWFDPITNYSANCCDAGVRKLSGRTSTH